MHFIWHGSGLTSLRYSALGCLFIARNTYCCDKKREQIFQSWLACCRKDCGRQERIDCWLTVKHESNVLTAYSPLSKAWPVLRLLTSSTIFAIVCSNFSTLLYFLFPILNNANVSFPRPRQQARLHMFIAWSRTLKVWTVRSLWFGMLEEVPCRKGLDSPLLCLMIDHDWNISKVAACIL